MSVAQGALLGQCAGLTLLPAATLGLMAATLEASKGKFPMPTILISAFRAGRERMRAMLTLGALYAVGFLAIMGISTLFDGGKFARLYLLGGKITQELVSAPDFQTAMWVSTALYLPLSMLFWHAPALVHWHGVTPVKSLFFSVVACVRNIGAFTSMVWPGWCVHRRRAGGDVRRRPGRQRRFRRRWPWCAHAAAGLDVLHLDVFHGARLLCHR
jgi:hypothetical protein